jgi:cytidylate kinase
MPLITITHDLGCDGPAIGMHVSKALGLEYYDDANLQKMAAGLGLADSSSNYMDEKTPGILDRMLSHRPQLYLDVMEAVIYEVARKGEGVIIGHGGQFLLRDFGCAFHVKIQARKSTRVKKMTDQHGLKSAAAEALIRNADQQKKGFYRYAFQLDPRDPELYDLIINQEKFDTEAAARIITDCARMDALSQCSLEAMQAMDRLSLEKRIHAELVENRIDITMINIEVIEGGVVHISGMANTGEEKDRILKLVEEISAVKKVRSSVEKWVYSI